MASELYRRMLMFSPEILEDIANNGSVGEKTLSAITHSVGAAAASPNPFRDRRDTMLQEQAERLGVVRRNMFGQATAGPAVSGVAKRFQSIIESKRAAASGGAVSGGDRTKNLFSQYK